MKQSKLARRLGVPWIPQRLIGPESAAAIAGVRMQFLCREIETGAMPTVVFVPGFYRISLNALETWYECVPTQFLDFNRDERFSSVRFGLSSPQHEAPEWLRSYSSELVRRAVRLGFIKRGRCMICGEQNAAGHHSDYSKPLSVIWLCKRDHLIHHGRLNAAEKEIRRTELPAQLNLLPLAWLTQMERDRKAKAEVGR